MAALVALAKADTVVVRDIVNQSLIVASIIGTMSWTAASSWKVIPNSEHGKYCNLRPTTGRVTSDAMLWLECSL
jgi:hypothetical protein